MTITIKDKDELREAFWQQHPQYAKTFSDGQQNRYPADVRMAWVDFVDHMQKDGQITEELADVVTL